MINTSTDHPTKQQKWPIEAPYQSLTIADICLPLSRYFIWYLAITEIADIQVADTDMADTDVLVLVKYCLITLIFSVTHEKPWLDTRC